MPGRLCGRCAVGYVNAFKAQKALIRAAIALNTSVRGHWLRPLAEESKTLKGSRKPA
jgi:hypothetical protein